MQNSTQPPSDEPTSTEASKPSPEAKADASSSYRLTPSEIESLRQDFDRCWDLMDFSDLFKK